VRVQYKAALSKVIKEVGRMGRGM